MHFDCDLAPFASFRIETLTLPCPWKCVPLLNSFKQIQTRGVFVILWTSYQSASVSSKIFFLIKHNSKKYLPKVVFVFCKIFGSLQKHNLYGQLVSSVHGIIHHWRPVVNFSVWMATVVQPSGLCLQLPFAMHLSFFSWEMWPNHWIANKTKKIFWCTCHVKHCFLCCGVTKITQRTDGILMQVTLPQHVCSAEIVPLQPPPLFFGGGGPPQYHFVAISCSQTLPDSVFTLVAGQWCQWYSDKITTLQINSCGHRDASIGRD